MDTEDGTIRPDELLNQLGWVRALARSLVLDPDLADDVLQQVCLLALQQAPRDASEGPRLRAWLAAVTRSLAGRSLRSDSRRRKREQAAARSEALPSAAETAQHREALRALVGAVTSLDEPYFSTVVARYFQGLSVAEIAARHGLTAAAVRQRLSRAKQQLRGRLTRLIEDEPGGWLTSVLALPAAGASLQGALLLQAASQSALSHVGGVVLAKQIGIGSVTKVLVGLLVAAGLLYLTADWLRSGEPDESAAAGAVAALGSRAVADPAGLPLAATDAQPVETATAPPLEGALAPLEPGDVLARLESLPVTIDGRVIDEARLPLSGATVELRGPDFGDATFMESLIASTISDADGRFSLPASLPPLLHLPQRQVFLTPLAEGPDLWVTLAGRLPVIRTVPVARAGQTQAGDIVLPQAGRLAFTARDAGGNAVRAARVELDYTTKFGRTGMLALKQLELRDEGAGHFVAEGLPAGTTSVSVIGDGLASVTFEAVELRPGETTDIGPVSLQAAARLSGAIVDSRGEAVPGAWVIVRPASRFSKVSDAALRLVADSTRRDARPQDLLTADADGRFVADSLAPGRYGVAAGAPGYASTLLRVVELNGPSVTLTLQPEGRLLVSVVDGETGQPAVPELVQVFDSSGDVIDLAPTSRAGTGPVYVLDSARGASLFVRCAGYAPQVVSLETIGPGEERTETVPLVRGCLVRGLVTDAAGAPLADRGVLVDTSYSRLKNFGVEYHERTDKDGRFELGLLTPGPWTLMAGGGSYSDLHQVVTIAPEQRELDVTLTLLAAANVAGRVVDARGTPVRDVSIGLLERALKQLGLMTRSDSEGRYEFEAIAPGQYKLFLPGSKTAQDFDLAPGQQASIDVVVPALARITGLVTSGGVPLGDATVQLHHETFGDLMPREEVPTDARGAYVFEGVEFGRYGVSATPRAGSRSPVLELAVAPGAEVVADLELSGGAIRGLAVLTGSGEPLAGVFVSLKQLGHDVLSPPTGPDGGFAFELVAPGSVLLEGAAKGYATVVRRIDVVADPSQPASVRLDFAPGATLEGAVQAPDGTPMGGMLTLRLTRDDEPDFLRKQPIEAGRYRIDSLGAGSYRVAVLSHGTNQAYSPAGKALVETTVTLTTGQVLTHDLVVPGT